MYESDSITNGINDISIINENINDNININTKRTILFCASYPNQPIGYSRIANILSNFLAAQENTKVYYFGFSNYENARVDRFIHPNITFIDVMKEESIKESREGFQDVTQDLSKENYGTTLIAKAMAKLRPDILFIYNDIIVTCRLFNALQSYKRYTAPLIEHSYKVIVYLDLVYKFEKSAYIEYVKRETDLLFVFSKCWKEHLVTDFNFDKNKVKVLKHGVNVDIFQKLPKEDCKKKLGCSPDDFIVVNTNRNSYRKMNDITIYSFLLFLKGIIEKGENRENSNKIKLLLTSHLVSNTGYDILELIKVYCNKLGLDYQTVINNNILSMSKNQAKITDQMMNVVYNASDIGLNTACGEGVGLCVLEGAYLENPQICTKTGGMKDILSEFPDMLVEPVITIQCPSLLDDHLGEMDIIDAKEVSKRIQLFYEDNKKRVEQGKLISKFIKFNYDWNKILEQFIKDINF